MHDVHLFIIIAVVAFILWAVIGYNDYNVNRKPLTLAGIILSIVLAIWGIFLLT